jgi:hypothetical protein
MIGNSIYIIAMKKEFSNKMQSIGEVFNKIMNENIDLRTKQVGDRVQIWDYSSVTDDKGLKLSRLDFLEIPYLIVIDTNRRTEMQILNSNYVQDLIVVDPKTNKKYRVTSKFVKRLDDHEK